MKLKTCIKILIALGLALIVPVTNYLVDPAGIYTQSLAGSTEGTVVQLLLSGSGAEGLNNYDERLVKRHCIYGISKDTEVLALGSSRVALVTAEMAGTESFFNLAVTGAGLQDVVAMYGVSVMNGITPERVIIALDPCFVNSNYTSFRFDGVLNDGYAYCLTQLMGYSADAVGYDSFVNGKYLAEGAVSSFFDYPLEMQQELFSIPYFQSSLQLLLSGTAEDYVRATDLHYTDEASLRPDGSYCYPIAYREAGIAQVTELADSQTWLVGENKARIIGCEDAQAGDPNLQLFADFVAMLVESGVQVDLLAVPLNPILWQYMQQHERYAPIIDSVDFFNRVAEENGCRIAGSFDPAALGAEITDFYDGYHYKPEKIAALLAQLEEVE